MMCRAFVAVVCLLAAGGVATAATVGIAWDASPEPTRAGYRVYVGTLPGVHTEWFDLGPHQTSFLYTNAVPGLRYYFAVATLAQGVIGPKSVEVSVVVEAGGDPTNSTTSPQRNSTGLAKLNAGSAPQGVHEIASGLGEVSSIARLPSGGGLFVEQHVRVRAFSNDTIGGLAYEAPPRTRLAALAVDPLFATTGFVYAVETRPELVGEEAVFVVRHRMLAGVLGESATIASAGRQPAGTAVGLAIAQNRDVVLVQGSRVTRFGQDGGVVGSWPMGLGPAGSSATPAVAYDARRDALWSVVPGVNSTLEISFVPLRDDGLPERMSAIESGHGDIIAAGAAVFDATAAVGIASATAVFRFDLTTSRFSSGTTVTDRGTVVSLLPVEPGTDLVVVREPVGAAGSYSLLRVQYAAGP